MPTYTNGAHAAAPAVPVAGALRVKDGRRTAAAAAVAWGGLSLGHGRQIAAAAGVGTARWRSAVALTIADVVGEARQSAGLRLGPGAAAVACEAHCRPSRDGGIGIASAGILPGLVGGVRRAPGPGAVASDAVLAMPAVWLAVPWPVGDYVGHLLASLMLLRGADLVLDAGLVRVGGRVVLTDEGEPWIAADMDEVLAVMDAPRLELLYLAGALCAPMSAARDAWVGMVQTDAARWLWRQSVRLAAAAPEHRPALLADMRWVEIRV